MNVPLAIILSICGKSALQLDARAIYNILSNDFHGVGKRHCIANGRYAELEELAFWTKEHVPASARLAIDRFWLETTFPAFQFVELSGHKMARTEGKDPASIRSELDYVVGEGVPAIDKTAEPGLQPVYQTSGNAFHVLRVCAKVPPVP